MAKRVITLRLEPDLLDWVDRYSRLKGGPEYTQSLGRPGGNHRGADVGRTALITELLTALREDRLEIIPQSGANPFPADEVMAGETPEFAILICTRSENE